MRKATKIVLVNVTFKQKKAVSRCFSYKMKRQ